MIRYRFLFLVVFLLSAFSAGIYGQVNKLTSKDSFSQESILIDFEGHADGAKAGTLFSAWGTVFFASDSTDPIIRYLPPGNFFIPDGPFNSLRNEVGAGSPSNGPLIINFRYPVRRAGFQLENGTSNSRAIIKAFDALGNALGTIEQDGLAGETFVGIEATTDPGIFKLTVDYGDGGPDEQIDDLMVDYQSRPTFTTYLAQIADGPLPSGALQTTIVVSNLTNTTARGELRLLDDGGLPLSFEMNGIPGSTFDLLIPPFSSRSFTSGGNALPPTPGYACIQSTVPVDGTAIFRVLDAQRNVTSEAGVGASVGRMTVVGAVQKFASGNFNSGVAVVNTSGQNTRGRIRLYDPSGTLVASNTDDLDLGPGEHVAKFLHELFSGVAEDFEGTVVVTADQPLALVVLRTIAGGLVISSLPAGSTQQ